MVVSRGEEFLADARARGAAATLVPDDAFAALAALAGAVRARSDAQVVGITGSVGKTSTKDILAALVRPHRRTVAAEDGFNNEIGLPLTLCRIEPDTEVVVAELSMRGLGQIRDLARIARPHVGVITSIAPVHLELLGSMENIARAKAELLEELETGVRRGAAGGRAGARAVRAGRASTCGASTRRRRRFEDGRTRVRWRGRDVVFGFTARHQVANAAAALTAAEALGLEPPREPVDVEFSRWRSQEVALPGGGLLINDAWNANPVAMRAALAHLLERADGRRTVAVLGDMAELGPEAPRFHGEIGEAALEVDVVVGVGELARGYSPDEWVATAADAVELVARRRAARRRDPREGLALGWARGRRGRSRGAAVVIRVLIAAGVALVLSIAIGPRFIEFLRRNEFGQHIREEGPKHHLAKQGTPTMGGLLILFAATIGFLPVSHFRLQVADGAVRDARVRGDRVPRRLHQAHAQAVARALGPVEARPPRGRDGRRRRRRAPPSPEHQRLHPRRRRLGAALVRVVPVPLPRDRRRVERDEPRRRRRRPPRGDGDHRPVHVHGDERRLVRPVERHPAERNLTKLDLAIVGAALIGAAIGFLWFNAFPAEMQMGDTGSMAFGGALAAFAIMMKVEFLLLFLGGIFVIEALSVMIQVFSFKRFGRRVFLMAPIHHHFEMKAWSETKIMVRFWIVGGLLCAVGFALYYRYYFAL